MSPPWTSSLDIERLADAHADLDFTVPVAELSLRERDAGLAGEVTGGVRFERAAGLPVAELTLRGTVRLTCQRCLGSVEVPVERQVRIGLIESEAALSTVPDDLEPVLTPGGRTSIGALVEEELLLTLPIVPQHEDGDPRCVPSGVTPPDEGAEAPPTHRPFADLGALLNRK